MQAVTAFVFLIGTAGQGISVGIETANMIAYLKLLYLHCPLPTSKLSLCIFGVEETGQEGMVSTHQESLAI